MKFLKLKCRDTDAYIFVNLSQVNALYYLKDKPNVCGVSYNGRDNYIVVEVSAEKLEKALGFHADVIEI